jgi:hypothetical protein
MPTLLQSSPMPRARFAAVLALLLALVPGGLAAQADAGTPLSVSEAWIIVAGQTHGAYSTEWRTDVVLTNTTGSQADVVLTLTSHPAEPFLMTTLAPGESLAFPNIAGDTFASQGFLSPIIVHTLASRSVSIRAFAYAIVDGQTTERQEIGVVYGRGFPPLQVLRRLAQDDTYRTNVGIANLSDERHRVVIALQRIAGRTVAATAIDVPPRSVVQLPLSLLFPLIESEGDLSVLVEVPSGDCYAYASVVNNETQRAVFVAPAAALAPTR